MSFYFLEESKQNSFEKYASPESVVLQVRQDDLKQDSEGEQLEKRCAFDLSLDLLECEDNTLTLEEILDKIVENLEKKKKKLKNKMIQIDEYQYFNHNFNLAFQNEDVCQQNLNEEINKSSLVHRIRDSVELKKNKQQKYNIEQVDELTENSKLNTTQQSFFESRFHDFQLPMKRGYLLKKSPTLFQGFQKRYCTLDNFYFNYYLPENKSSIFGSINFQIIDTYIQEIRDPQTQQLTEFKIVPIRSGKVFHFKSCDNNSQTLEEWIFAIKQHLEQAQYYHYRYKTCYLDKQFWKQTLISEHQFKQICDTGDILLFKNNSIGSAIQRTLTTSQYDHVGMILKYKCGKIVLFESNLKNGVNLTPWEQISASDWSNQFEKIAYRKLNYKKTQKQIQGFFNFMKITLGKQFDISTKQVLKSAGDRICRIQSISTQESKSRILNENNIELQDLCNKKESYFCSELIASCYQYNSLLPLNALSDQYWPVDFSEKKKLNFLQNASLSCEYQIIQPIQTSQIF
ncbi:PH domain protein (macronuclear) [Tetrahymena thermophila SB210]|uniref:PH domain protein n=1 Tax=Tetrahymena thermophila (strain SB210) TaxID=312017 RepID=I7MCJ6_TETTS|nr:PH domain protein [Tetrahymena thermophila SB210]EAR84066.2 PH domain protein [Tetrahymena thermophila SB210]|eukprot:XP_001031729.2 PH domain protein [Tetrahymena thermophila SB210]